MTQRERGVPNKIILSRTKLSYLLSEKQLIESRRSYISNTVRETQRNVQVELSSLYPSNQIISHGVQRTTAKNSLNF